MGTFSSLFRTLSVHRPALSRWHRRQGDDEMLFVESKVLFNQTIASRRRSSASPTLSLRVSSELLSGLSRAARSRPRECALSACSPRLGECFLEAESKTRERRSISVVGVRCRRRHQQQHGGSSSTRVAFSPFPALSLGPQSDPLRLVARRAHSALRCRARNESRKGVTSCGEPPRSPSLAIIGGSKKRSRFSSLSFRSFSFFSFSTSSSTLFSPFNRQSPRLAGPCRQGPRPDPEGRQAGQEEAPQGQLFFVSF